MTRHNPLLHHHHLLFLLLFSCHHVTTLPAADCPRDCSCATPETIFCVLRRSSGMPSGVPASTRNLYLFQNGIETLQQEDFEGLEELEMLDMSQNKLTELPDRVFTSLSNLRNLDLSANQITHIGEESFAGLDLLERLYVYSNLIQTIHPNAFDGLEHLLELKLQGNQLASLPALRMPSLLLLDLRFNHLPDLGPGDLQTPSLECLKLAGLGLTRLDAELLGGLSNLHELDVSGNQLSTFPPVLRQAGGLIRLSLAGNPMGPLRLDDFEHLGELQELDISNLSLQGFPDGFQHLFPNLRRLTVAENPFNCLCTLSWFPGWLRTQQVTLGRTQETRCHFPPLNAGKVLERLEHREFGCPTTTTLTPSTVRTTTAQAVLTTTRPSTTQAIPRPAPPNPSQIPSKDTDSDELPPPVPSSPSDDDTNGEQKQLTPCPSNICLNGGTCRVAKQGHLECACPTHTSGVYCEKVDDVASRHDNSPEVEDDKHIAPVTTVVPAYASQDISPGLVTSTSIRLDLRRYIEARPHIRGIRLTYRKLSGSDRRPMHLNIPASYPEYTLRGLRPNSTYTVCAAPLGGQQTGAAASVEDGDKACMEARTLGQQDTTTGALVEEPQLRTVLVPALAILLLLVVLAVSVGVACYLRQRRAKGHLELDCDAGAQLELEGVNGGLENGALPQKQSDPGTGSGSPNTATTTTTTMLGLGNGTLEYEIPLMQEHCAANNNVANHKPSYF
ncbi:vasorin b [Engraulis encrasicolus]|uniref:vasorin b n=1 Tax=Engraulis encrasicolus TaxID=184585 RepID=UPI002FD3D427